MYVNFDISWRPVVTTRNDVNCSRFVPDVIHDEVIPSVIRSFSDITIRVPSKFGLSKSCYVVFIALLY